MVLKWMAVAGVLLGKRVSILTTIRGALGKVGGRVFGTTMMMGEVGM